MNRFPRLILAMLMMIAIPARADDCENLVKMDGLLSKARRECPFSYYNFRFQQASQMCSEKTGEAQWKQLFSQGASAFDGKASSMGKSTLCAKLAKDFPTTVKF
jgi:hypothetical protein